MKHKKTIQFALSLFALFAVSFFFFREFQKNLVNIQAFNLKLDLRFILLSFAAVVVNYLLTTYAWFLTLNSLSGHKIAFLEGVATVNTSNLMKYVPGKVWSYALQMYWMADAGFSKSLILYVNIINLCSTLITSMILALSYLVFSPGIFPRSLTLYLLGALLVFDFLFIKYNSRAFKWFIGALNRIFKRDIGYYETPVKLLCYLQVINFVGAFCFGLGAFLLCFGIGFDIDSNKVLLIMSSLVIADVIGFVAFIVPGGLGVREGVMYLMLHDVSIPALAIILPIATRIVSMFADISLGAIGILLLKRIAAAKR